MSNTNPFVLGQHITSTTPRRPSTSGGRSYTSFTAPRPSTSSGEVQPIVAKSALLRDALRDLNSPPVRARSTTPRRQRPALRSQSYKDEWLQSSDDDKKAKIKPRPIRQRRASEISSSQHAGSASSFGSRETSHVVDKYQKEVWNLKHTISLLQESQQRKQATIQELEGVHETLKIARERIEDLATENDNLRSNNEEMVQINDELISQLETKDREYEEAQQESRRDASDRQSAIEEAAGMIQNLEAEKYELQSRLVAVQQYHHIQRGDSDYHSAEPDSEQSHNRIVQSTLKTPILGDSDYFSADTSPLITPKTIKDNIAVPTIMSSAQWNAAHHVSIAFNREVGIRSQISDNSLFSSYLDDAKIPEVSTLSSNITSARILRLRSLRSRAQSPKSATKSLTTSGRKQASQVQDARPLRNLYATGELAMQIDSNDKPVPPRAPSDKSSLVSPCSSSVDDTFLGRDLGGPKASSAPSIVAVPASPNTPSRTESSSEILTKKIPIRLNSKISKTSRQLERHHTVPTALDLKPKLSPTRTLIKRRGSNDEHWPQSLTSSFSSHKSPRSPHQRSIPNNVASSSSATDELQGREGNSKTSLPLTSPTYATPPAQTAPTYSATKPTTRTHRSPPTPNFSHWPRRYPAWPPSAGLVNRDLLFHGEGMDEMFPTDSEASP